MGDVVAKNKNTIIFLLVFLLYLILSVGIIKYNIITKLDINFLGIDEPRVLNDMFNVTGDRINHDRTKVHPLFLLIVQPLLHIINGFVHDLGAAVAIGQSIAGIIIIFCVYRILKNLEGMYLLDIASSFLWAASGSYATFYHNLRLCWIFPKTIYHKWILKISEHIFSNGFLYMM